ncbi:MAG: hypothetical protein JNM95_14340 [Chitinophagaceae bacterium]|nr:hypothetical protein [Chitinophagaceae bacterium]
MSFIIFSPRVKLVGYGILCLFLITHTACRQSVTCTCYGAQPLSFEIDAKQADEADKICSDKEKSLGDSTHCEVFKKK